MRQYSFIFVFNYGERPSDRVNYDFSFGFFSYLIEGMGHCEPEAC